MAELTMSLRVFRTSCRRAALVLLLGAANAVPVAAQTPEMLDVGDLWRIIRHKPPPDPAAAADYRKRALAIVPTISSKPSSGLSLGVGLSLARFLGPPDTTQISSLLGSASFSTKKQASITARFDAFSTGNRVHLQGDNRFQWTSQDTYGLGTATPADAAIGARFTHVRVYETALFSLGHALAAGAGINFSSHTNIRPGDESSAWDTSPPNAYANA